MERRIWKIVGLLGGITLALVLAFATGILTLPPNRGAAGENSIIEPSSAGVAQPGAESVGTLERYPAITDDAVATATQDWLTYVNETYGFKIRYPAHFYTTTWEVVSPREMYISFIDRKWKGYEGGAPDIGIVIYRNPEKLPLQTWLQAHTGDPADPKTAGSILFVDPDKIEAVQTANAAALRLVNGGLLPVSTVLIERADYILGIGYPVIGSDNLEPVYELMLATLEFEPLSRQEQE
ncbi:MAG TPA: hypothetical protein PLH19_16380 [Anaerolineae bacterium]|nr:hypothetical protein [Anaerolineae bacterium]